MLLGLSAFLTQCAHLSRLFLKDHASDRFQILYSDSPDIENVLHCSLIAITENCQNYRIYEDLGYFRPNV